MTIDGKEVNKRYEEYLNVMVDKFLGWKLPRDFYPDAGVTFNPSVDYESPYWPVGTNLFTAEQVKEMFKECVPPSCFGLDDCSSQMLSHCKFADQCGVPYE